MNFHLNKSKIQLFLRKNQKEAKRRQSYKGGKKAAKHSKRRQMPPIGGKTATLYVLQSWSSQSFFLPLSRIRIRAMAIIVLCSWKIHFDFWAKFLFVYSKFLFAYAVASIGLQSQIYSSLSRFVRENFDYPFHIREDREHFEYPFYIAEGPFERCYVIR